MRSLLLCLLTIGLASSQLLFTPGNEYVYTYSGKILSGIPELDSTFAGLSISSKVIVQATGQDTFKLAMREVGFSTFNEKLTGPQPLNWRTVVTPTTSPLIALHKQYMESPVEFIIVNGEVSTVKISSEEPQWSINFKKALVASLKIQLPIQEVDGLPSLWTTMEQGIEGNCENTYQISELPEYLINDYEQGMMHKELCQGKKFYQILKVRDFTKCAERSVFISSKTHKKCLLGDCNGANTKSSTTRYFGCGETMETLQLHGMINEGELQQAVLAFNTEPVVTGTKQVLKLIAVKPVTTNIPAITSPVTLTDLMYVFSNTASSMIKSNEEQKQHFQLSRMDPATQMFIPEGPFEKMSKQKMSNEEMSMENIRDKAVEQLTIIANQMTDIEHFGDKDIPTQLNAFKSVLSFLTTEDLKDIYTAVKVLSVPSETKETIRTILLETVRLTGTSPAVMFLKDMIETEQLTNTEALMAMASLAHNLKTPTDELIDQIFELIKSPVVRNNPVLKVHSHIVFVTIIRKACLTTPMNEVFPEYVFGKMCSPDNVKITQEYIPHIIEDLKAATPGSVEQTRALTPLSALGHESVIPLVMSYVEGKVEGISSTGRKLAIYSLAGVAMEHRNILLPAFSSLVHNPAEERGVRIAAFYILITMQPSIVHLQKLAVSTWFEQDAEMHKFIYSSLRSLAHISQEDSQWSGLTSKVQTVLPLAKPVPGIISSSFNSYMSEVLKNLQVGARVNTFFVTETTGHHVYHKTENLLKNLQTIPLEFSVNVRGLKSFVSDIVKTITGDSASYLEKIHPEWRKIVENMEISTQADAPFEADMWAKISNDVQFVFDADSRIVDMIKEKIKSSLKAPGTLLQKVCGKTPININKVFETLPYLALIPSDLGFPIFVDTQLTHLVSMKGDIDVDCVNPSIAVNIAKKTAYSYNGVVGTVSPFTNEVLVAGINTHRASNIPIKAMVEVVPSSNLMKIVLKQMDSVTPTTSMVDMHHYHVKPFTTLRPLVFPYFTHHVLHENTKVIQSEASKKTFQVAFGETFGLDLSLKVETECDVYDRKTVLDAWANYKYNPFLAGWFHFTETALKANGMPTARFHKYTLVHNPAMSSTKEAEVTVMLTVATKKQNERPQLITIAQSQIQTRDLTIISKHEQSLHESIKKLDSETAYAMNTLITAKLLGGQEKSYTCSITAGKGSNTLEHKWNLHIDTEVAPLMNVCVEGYMKYPAVPSAGIKFKYFNHIGFGETCDQYFVDVDGTAAVSGKQQQYSKISYESKQCEKLTIESQKLSNNLKSQMQEQDKIKLQKKYSQVASQQQDACTLKNGQAYALDQAVVEISTSDDLPVSVYTFGRLVNSGLKALLFEYISALPVYKPTNKIQVKLNFNQKLNTVTMFVQTPLDTMVYKNIRLPAQMENMLPLVANKSPLEQSYNALTGSSLYAKCSLGQGYVQTFDKKTYSYQVDQCDHILTSDCSKEFQYAVLVKEVAGLKHITVYHSQTKIVLKPVQSYSPYADQFMLEFNGQEIPIVKTSPWAFKSADQLSSYSAYWCSIGQAVVLDTPSTRVTYNGKTATVEEKNLMADGSHCGLCGDYNNDKRADVASPKGCVYKSYGTAALSYRVKNAQCALSWKQQQLIQTEEEQCVKHETINTPLSSLANYQQSYSMMKHTYIYQGAKICISQKPVVQCTPGFTPRSMSSISVSFVCLPEGRVSKLYAERIERGESPQELMQQTVAFEAKMGKPTSCGPQ